MVFDTVRFATCPELQCGRASVRGRGCSQCGRNLCSFHLQPQFHTCGSTAVLDDQAWEQQIHDEVLSLLASINIHALVEHASTTNNGVKCTFEPGKYLGAGAVMGCANYHGWLRFDNGTSWLVRVPRVGQGDVPNDLIEYLVRSEYATLKYLEKTKIPAPKAYSHGLSSDPSNNVGVSYICMEVLSGSPYNPYRATPEVHDKVLDQLADILKEISNHALPLAGSLILDPDGATQVSSFASNRFVALHRYGPFDNAAAYFTATAEQHLDLIADGQLYDEYPIEAFRFYLMLREHAGLLAQHEQPGRFFLKHVDDKGDHLLVDGQGNVTGIIDWQFARCVPASEAFGPSYFTADMDTLYSGEWAVTAQDRRLAQKLRAKGAPSLADHMERDDLARVFCHGLASGLSKGEAELLMANVAAGLKTRGLWKGDDVLAAQTEKDPRYAKLKSLEGQ